MNYNSMKATKSGKKSYSNWSTSRDTQRSAKRASKKINANWFVVILILIIGAVGGFFAHNLVFKNDVYEMVSANGETDVVIGGMEDGAVTTYTELGVKCIAFGKDYSKECTVKYYYRSDLTEDEREVSVDEINTSNVGIFYAVYECPAQKYASVRLIRNIIVLGGEDNG